MGGADAKQRLFKRLQVDTTNIVMRRVGVDF